jgi:hypothetical protein
MMATNKTGNALGVYYVRTAHAGPAERVFADPQGCPGS